MTQTIDLSGFTGSETFYKHLFGYTLSEGAFYLAEKAGAHWLMDAIISHQTEAKVRRQEFQVWKLVAPGDTDKFRPAELICEDGNGHKVASQTIDGTDFPMTEATLWLQNKVVFLPSEY